MDRPGPRWRSILVLICAWLAAGVPSAAAQTQIGELDQLPLVQGCISEPAADGCAAGRALDHADGITVSPDGKNAYVASLEGDAVAIFDRDPLSGALTQKAGVLGCMSHDGSGGNCTDGRALDQATGVAVSPDGEKAYVVSSFSDAVLAFDRDPGSGALAQRPGSAGCINHDGVEGCAEGRGFGGTGRQDVAVSPDGRHVYTTGHNGVQIFDRDATGALTQKPGADGCISKSGAEFEGCDIEGRGGIFGEALTLISPRGENVYFSASLSNALATFSRETPSPPPSVSIGDASGPEGDAGTTALTFTVTLSAPPLAAGVTVDYATSDGSATAGSDYTAESGTITFAAGDTEETVTVDASGDTAGEPDEDFFVNLFNAQVAIVEDASGTGTIQNDDAPPTAPTLTVVKQVVNDDGGTGGAPDWDVHVTQGGADVTGSPQPGDEAGTSYTLEPGSYIVSEAGGPAGYAASIAGDCSADGTITLAAGDDKTCTITNDDVAPRLTVVKHVVNDDGGVALASDWSMHVQTGEPLADVEGSPFTGSETGTTVTVDAGSYVVSESDGPKGYALSITGDCAADGAITLALGDDKTCTLTNNDEPAPATATLRVVKRVVNDDGGTASAGDWSMHVRTGAPPEDVEGSPFPGSEDGTSMTLQADTYTVGESGGPAGYAASFSGNCDAAGHVTLRQGEDKTCTITNDDIAPTLRVVKHVVNDDGGTAAADDWSMHIRTGGTEVAGSPFPGSEAGTATTLDAGSYEVSETGGLAGYTASISGDCAPDGAITLALGEDKTCTITNDDVAPTLRVVKHVINDDGGGAMAGDWSTHIKTGVPLADVAGSPFPGSEAGTTTTLDAGAYTVSESAGPAGYTASISGDCDAAGRVTLQPGDNKTCTITNDDDGQPTTARLHVVKHVVNDDGGVAVAGDWSMHIRSGGADVTGSPFQGSEAGTSMTLVAGSYVVGESGGPGGYTTSITGDCNDAGEVSLQPGDTKTCTITGDDVAQPPPPPSSADLELSKSASDRTPGLGDNFTYLLTVFNRGPGTAAAVTLTDDLVAALHLNSVPAGCSAHAIAGGARRVTCGLGDLASGVSRTVILNVEARVECDFVGTTGDDGDGSIGSTRGRDLICGGGGKDKFSGAGDRDRLFGFAPPGMLPEDVGNTAGVTSTTPDPEAVDNSASVTVRVVGGRDRGDTILGEGGNDKLYGSDGNDRLFGGEGADRLEGQDGKDLLEGGADNDRIKAVDGLKDKIRCGPGRDRVTADPKDTVSADCERVVRRTG